MPYYLNTNLNGLITSDSLGDGYSINLKWAQAYTETRTNKIAYNIYVRSDIVPDFTEHFFDNSPSFVSVDGKTNIDIIDLIPGQMYHFAVRAIEYDATFFDLATLPQAFGGLRIYPESLLRSNITETSLIIPLVDADLFPVTGTIKIGAELINYASVDYINNNLIVPGGGPGTNATLVDQGSGQFYTLGGSNTGQGTINNLSIVGSGPTETWKILCVSTDGYGGQFEAIGSVSGTNEDGYGNVVIWDGYGPIESNGILSFSITPTFPTFILGDYFIVKVSGSTLGAGNRRGFNNTVASPHRTDGYDGSVFWDPNVLFYPIISEEQNTRVFECWNRFDTGPSGPNDKDHYPYTVADGYHQKTKDILTTDLSASDAANAGFPSYDFGGYHRTDPVMLLSGACVGSYIGGYQFCADGYGGVGQQLRGISVQDQNTQRQEVLLSLDGEGCVLVKKTWTGITCDCFLPYNEYPEARCKRCYGTGFVVGYQQYFNPREVDGKIQIRFDPAVDDLIPTDSGLESTMLPTCWTLTVPTIKDRDFIVRFDIAGNEEFRYEVLNVTRNRLFFGKEGVQKFALQRVRKTDPIYQVKVFRDTSMFPSQLSTSIASSPGIPAHTHTIVISEKIISVGQINQITSINQGHSHTVQNGIVLTEGLHSHLIILP